MNDNFQDREDRILTSNFANDNLEVYSSQQCIGHINNISPTGFMFFSKHIYNRDSDLELEIEIPNTANRIMLKVNVRWNDPEINTIGVKIYQEYLTAWQEFQTKLS